MRSLQFKKLLRKRKPGSYCATEYDILMRKHMKFKLNRFQVWHYEMFLFLIKTLTVLSLRCDQNEIHIHKDATFTHIQKKKSF